MSAHDEAVRLAAEVIYPKLEDAWARIFSDHGAEADEAAEAVVVAIEPVLREAGDHDLAAVAKHFNEHHRTDRAEGWDEGFAMTQDGPNPYRTEESDDVPER